jgi:hypothetical protein
MSEQSPVRRVALATGIVAVVALVCLVGLLVGAPTGTINDYANGLLGVMSGVLAVVAFRAFGGSLAGVALAVVGAVVAVIGSWLVISDTTGFILAGLVSSVGFGLIGGWLVLLHRSGAFADAVGSRGRRWASIAGWLMLAGLVAVLGVLMRVDSYEATPPWLWIYGIGWLGTYVVYPAWCLLVGRLGSVRR